MGTAAATLTRAAPVGGRGRFRPAAVLMNLWCYPAMALWTALGIILFPLLFASWKVATRWPADRIMRHIIWVYGRGWMAVMSPFVSFSRLGFGETGLPRPAILVVNHLSFFDTYFMAALPVFDVTFAVRAWPFRMPWYGRFMRLARYLDVESLGWEECLAAARDVLSRGSSLLFFPEGHRSRDGRLQRFYSGAFKTAIETGDPVVPLVISGTDVLLGPGRFWMQPARVSLRVLPPVDPAPFGGPEGHLELRRRVKEAMEAHILA